MLTCNNTSMLPATTLPCVRSPGSLSSFVDKKDWGSVQIRGKIGDVPTCRASSRARSGFPFSTFPSFGPPRRSRLAVSWLRARLTRLAARCDGRTRSWNRTLYWTLCSLIIRLRRCGTAACAAILHHLGAFTRAAIGLQECCREISSCAWCDCEL